ncbi:fungal-specific transcription factor domain-containing protein [Immersiella caudata]|uniref:Fungal-specific transcription factor domain-containing protein n=1 Tax=Immersiella caudata TaxID=314043 RepID=A0AA39WS94_9PEZI|nr:fungal-specific transcription factor domain-containing protein [Immersiella caudata]
MPLRDDLDSDFPQRTAHTLTACCRCRQRKTRCDPTLPRCSPCERSGSTCEYFDTTKGKKINRAYVVKLQETVRKLERDLKQYTDDTEFSDEAMVRPGGMVRLNESDETPRYLGPSSGIAMTRLLMEEAKRYTDSKRIADLIPEITKRRRDRANRMQSVVSTSGSISDPSGRKKSYPMVSEHPAATFPAKKVYDGLLECFNQRAHFFAPILHEKALADDFEAVYAGDTDSYKNFVVRMVLAISLQKMESKWAGIADSYYLAAMQYFEDVIRPKDIKALQCLILIAQYSLLTPTRTAVYYIIGFATRICQQLGLNEEKTIGVGITDPQALDMRRRLVWIATANELGLAHTMGRPSGFAKGNDHIDVKFFETVDDEYITPDGIKPGPPSEKKMVAMHFCKMRLLQAEIRRTLYETKRSEPSHESHPWFSQMEQKCKQWLESAPEQPAWSKHWFTGRFHTLMITMYRPSPQIPKPTSEAADICFDAVLYIINLSKGQVETGAVDVTWVFMLVLYMALNTLLWTISYPEIREKHPRAEVEELVDAAIDIIEQCSERWPGSASAAQLYAVFAKACMQSYNVKQESLTPPAMATDSGLDTPPSLVDTSSPGSDSTATGPSSQHSHSQPAQMFGYVFGATPEEMSAQYSFDAGPPSFFNRQPSFRSGSIFHNPGTGGDGRRGSYFPPDFTQESDGPMSEPMDEATPPGNAMSQSSLSPPTATVNITNALPTPPESLAPPPTDPNGHLSPMSSGMRSASPTPTPTMRRASPVPMSVQASPVPPPNLKFESPDFTQSHLKPQGMPPPRTAAFTIPPPSQPHPQQRGIPTTVTDWFSPPAPFISPHAFSGGGGPPNPAYWGDNTTHPAFVGLGLTNNDSYTISGRDVIGASPDTDFDMFSGGMPYQFTQERHGSLSQEQQLELMDVLETEGMSDINTFLSSPHNMGGMGGGIDGVMRWA